MFRLIIIASLMIVGLISSILFKPLPFKKLKIETFWIMPLIGVLLLIAFQVIGLSEIWEGLVKSSTINPLNLLILFLSMTFISIILDELGFFKQLAALALNKAGGKQIKLLIYLYGLVSFLTIFTSNDIIILTFTPFICYFAKYAGINPLPFLIAEFVGANTWSMLLIIGNPTNIFLASSFQIDFLTYFKTMAIPTIISSSFAFGLLLLIFKKSLLKEAIIYEPIDSKLKHQKIVLIALIHLALCTIFLSIATYLNRPMWTIAFGFALSLCIFILLFDIIHHRCPITLVNALKRLPWSLIPFILSMFILVLSLNKYSVTYYFYQLLSNGSRIWVFGITSFLASNVINNIPMTVLFSNIISYLPNNLTPAIYASIIGSNIGAYLTPLGALAGIMWMRILKKERIDFSFISFLKYGILISIPTIMIALLTLSFFI